MRRLSHDGERGADQRRPGPRPSDGAPTSPAAVPTVTTAACSSGRNNEVSTQAGVLKVQGGACCSGAGRARGPASGHRLNPHHGTRGAIDEDRRAGADRGLLARAVQRRHASEQDPGGVLVGETAAGLRAARAAGTTSNSACAPMRVPGHHQLTSSPAARTCTRTSFLPGSGRGTSVMRTTSGPPYLSNSAARTGPSLRS